ncbi:glycosyltransferase [Janibacter terrae]|uniref:4,4'-diaponeurosporenoate glycosyltransferase n=1 Tax=Janibacter terrae TaxID=103817 RepID=A0ABZ2FGC8_9MICO
MDEQPDLVTGISAVAVVVPANDEEVLLPRCLTALAHAVATLRAARPDVRVEVVVALDACTDGTAAVAARHGVHTTMVDARCVGAARAAGAVAAHELLEVGATHRAAGAWMACTDADSVVPADWLTGQVAAADGGADLVLGRVRPDPLDLDGDTYREWSRRHTSAHPTRHVHGANLGVRWSAFAAVGGFAQVPEHEDVLLVEALLAAGASVAAGPPILTSGRRAGRVPDGFSGYLRDLDATLGR